MPLPHMRKLLKSTTASLAVFPDPQSNERKTIMAESHGLHVEFYIDSKHMPFLSEEAGRPVHQDAEFVKIMIPGDKNTLIEREAIEQDRDKFPLEYARFKNGLKEEMQAVGTPLKAWPAMSRALVKDLAHFNVHTVEQLASM